MFELAWKLSRDSNDLLWLVDTLNKMRSLRAFVNTRLNMCLFSYRWAIIGAAEQQLLGKVETKTSVMDNGKLQSHMIRLAHLQQSADSVGTKDALYITHEKE